LNCYGIITIGLIYSRLVYDISKKIKNESHFIFFLHQWRHVSCLHHSVFMIREHYIISKSISYTYAYHLCVCVYNIIYEYKNVNINIISPGLAGTFQCVSWVTTSKWIEGYPRKHWIPVLRYRNRVLVVWRFVTWNEKQLTPYTIKLMIVGT